MTVVLAANGCVGVAEETPVAEGELPPFFNPARMDATLRSFAGIARYDWDTALEMMALPATARAWGKQNGGLFASPIHSAAFFSHTHRLFAGSDTDHWVGGLYNPWLDCWLLAEFVYQEAPDAERIAQFAWVSGGSRDALATAVESAHIETILRERWRHALERGRRGARKMLQKRGGKRLLSSQIPEDSLAAHVERMRSALAPEGLRKWRSLRRGLERFFEELASGTPAWRTRVIEQVDWPAELAPVFLGTRNRRATVILSASRNPYQVVTAQFDVQGERAELTGVDIFELPVDAEVRP